MPHTGMLLPALGASRDRAHTGDGPETVLSLQPHTPIKALRV